MKHIKLFEEHDHMQRLSQLGMTNPVEAAKYHLIRISKETSWPLTELDDTQEEDEDSGERYFVPVSSAFEDSGVDWSMFTVGIEPDGGVNFHYDASPQAVKRLHSAEDSQFMSQVLSPVPIPFSELEAEDWTAVLANIEENNDWGEDDEDDEVDGNPWYRQNGED